jgi:hypothetical protein
MKIRVIVAVALAAVGGTASLWKMPAIAAPLSAESILAQTQGQTYSEPNGLFEISFPAGYTYARTGSGITFSSADQKFGGSVEYRSHQDRALSLAQLEANFKSEYESRFSNIVWQGSLPQADGSLRLDWVGRDSSGNRLDAISFVEQRGSTVFILNLFGINTAYQDYNPDAEAIVSTYQASPTPSSSASGSPARGSSVSGSPPSNSSAPSSSAPGSYASALSALVSSALRSAAPVSPASGSSASGSSAPSSPVNRSAPTSPNRFSQCNQLITIANRAVSTVQNVTQDSNSDDAAAMAGIADAVDRSKREMQTLRLSDPQLVGFQNRFMSMYTETSIASRALIEAAGRKDTQAAQNSFDALKAATDREAPLVEEVNRYCGS